MKDAVNVLSERKSSLNHYTLTEEGTDAVGSICGGEIHVFIQSYHPPPRLIIVGGGHIGKPLKVMGAEAGFNVITVDIEPGRAEVPELAEIDLTKESYVVLITTDHISGEAALRYTITTPARYIGMIGSKAKCQAILSHLELVGIKEADLDRVYGPIGLDLGGTTPQEIAVAILAEIVAVRRGKR